MIPPSSGASQETRTELSPVKRAIAEIRDLRATIQAAERAANEPIAIVGVGCRFPGADGPDAYWRLLHEGTDAIGLVPPDRWDADALYDPDPAVEGKIYTRHGGFLDRVDTFDAAFFGISPREAVSLDPQQRLLLEVAWEALEHAGIPADSVKGTRGGVFLGLTAADYGTLFLTGAMSDISAYVGTGNALSVAAGRLSYVFGLQGPCLSVDTACSSSLVAVHLACQSLRSDECRLAFAGGANLILRPEATVNFCRARMLAPDGRCKTFDAAADGYSRGEGAGIVLLKRLSHAIEDGNRVLGLILGSTVNQDGRTAGLTVPNGPSQEALIRDALAKARVQPSDVDYIEAHGTGTSLGDPIEMHSLREVFGGEREAQRPLVIGSVKTNFGHLEAAAGVAGLIKVVLALQHSEIPPHLHLERLNPHMDFSGFAAVVPTTPRPWPAGRTRRIAGVSAFGFSGTNAHVVLAEGPAEA
ncbi:MAG: polyketide synthase, partial [Acidobacteriota bacterium]